MKKLLIIGVLVVSFMLTSCEIFVKYTIKVKNNCNHEITICIDRSSVVPTATPVNLTVSGTTGSEVTFSDMEYGNYYVYIRPKTDITWTYLPLTMQVKGNDIWTITKPGTSYVITGTF